MRIIVLSIMVLSARVCSGEPTVESSQFIADMAKSFMNSTSSDDGLESRAVFRKFESDVPQENRLQSLSKMWLLSKMEPDEPKVRVAILGYLIARKIYDWHICRQLEAQIYGCINDSDNNVRRCVLNMIARSYSYSQDRLRPSLLVFLNGKDDSIRGDAIRYMHTFRDRDRILALYVRQHAEDNKYGKPVKPIKKFFDSQQIKVEFDPIVNQRMVDLGVFAESFGSDVTARRKKAYTEFTEKIPDTKRKVALSYMWEIANRLELSDEVRVGIVRYLLEKNILDWYDCAELECQIYDAGTSGKISVRSAVLELICKTYSANAEKLCPLLFIFLTDASDDIRTYAIEQIGKLESWEDPIRFYIDEHGANKNYLKSIAAAKHMLELNEKQK